MKPGARRALTASAKEKGPPGDPPAGLFVLAPVRPGEGPYTFGASRGRVASDTPIATRKASGTVTRVG